VIGIEPAVLGMATFMSFTDDDHGGEGTLLC
jgi:hypothetical protein